MRIVPVTQPTESKVRGWAALAVVAYGAVVVALTMLKAFFVIGLLWRPESQRGRSVEWVPFAQFRDAQTWFGPVFDALGNLAFFVPLGVLLYILLEGRARAVLVVVTGAAISVTVVGMYPHIEIFCSVTTRNSPSASSAVTRSSAMRSSFSAKSAGM